MARFYVNLDHVATIRQARRTPYPDVLEAARMAEASGSVSGITLHLREDRRHVQDEDMVRVRREVKLPFNFEMSVAPDIVRRCLEVAPAQATLVPERREELTTEGGLDLVRSGDRAGEVIRELRAAGIVVSLFIDPVPEMVWRSKELGATHVELHTGGWAEAAAAGGAEAARDEALGALVLASREARRLGLVVNAGHGLTVDNVGPVAAIPQMNDLNIGHAVVARSIFVGLPAALREMADAIRNASGA